MAENFKGNLQGTPSRPLEMLTSSKAVTASYALTSEKLGENTIGSISQSLYLSGGVPVAITESIGSKSRPVYLDRGKIVAGDVIPTSETASWAAASNWITANSAALEHITGSSADISGLVAKSSSWDSAATWAAGNSASIEEGLSSTLTIETSEGTPEAKTVQYSPNSGNINLDIVIPSQPSHIGALSVSGGEITGDLTVDGNLTVKGTTVTIDAENLNVKDKLILVASGSDSQAAANGAGIAVQTGSSGEASAARIQYRSSDNKFTSSVGFVAPSFTGSLQGSASYALEARHAVSASEAVHAESADSATTASYLAGEVATASYASIAGQVAWSGVQNRPSFYSASFTSGAFSKKTYGPTSGSQTISIPTEIEHINGLSAVSTSVAQLNSYSASWKGVANTASAAYQSASQALATASFAKKEAESASLYKEEASASMEDARFYSAQAATNATLASTYANNASASADRAQASASNAGTSAANAATYASRAQASASNAHTSKTLAAASASAAATSATQAQTYRNSASSSASVAANWAVSASVSATSISASTVVAANWAASSSKYATNASASASLMFKNVGSTSVPVFMSASVGPVAVTKINLATITASTGFRGNLAGNVTGTASYATVANSVTGISAATISGSITAAINALVNTSGSAWKADNNTTYTFANGTKGSTGFSVTPSGGTAQNVTVGLAQQAASASILSASSNVDRPVALLETSSATAGCVIYDTAITYNPSSNILKATNISATNVTASTGFRGNLTGTASYATTANSANSAIKLAGTSGSATVPVYINAGVPTVVTSISGAFAIKGTQITASTGFRGNLAGNVTGTASYAAEANSANSAKSMTITDWRTNDNTVWPLVWAGTPQTGSAVKLYVTTGSITVKAKSGHIVANAFSGSLRGTASYATNAKTADSASIVGPSTANYNRPVLLGESGMTSTTNSPIYASPGRLYFNPSTSVLTVESGSATQIRVASTLLPPGIGFTQGWSSGSNRYSILFGAGSGGSNRGIYQVGHASGSIGMTASGWLLSWGATTTASFMAGTAVSATKFIGALQGNATTATRATLLVNATSGSSAQPVYISAGKPTACSGYVVTAAQTASWIASGALAKTAIQPAATASWATASNMVDELYDVGQVTYAGALTAAATHSVVPGKFHISQCNRKNIRINLQSASVKTLQEANNSRFPGSVRHLRIWGGVLENVNTVTFVNDGNIPFKWSENTADIVAGNTYEYNFIQVISGSASSGSIILGIVSKFS